MKPRIRAGWAGAFLVGILAGALVAAALQSAAQVTDGQGRSMLLLIDDDNDPNTPCDAWVGDPQLFRFDRSGAYYYQVYETADGISWQMTGWGQMQAQITVNPDGTRRGKISPRMEGTDQ